MLGTMLARKMDFSTYFDRLKVTRDCADRVATRLLALIRQGRIDFPFRKYFMSETYVLEKYDDLKKMDIQLETVDSGLLYRFKPEYYEIDMITDLFTENERMKAKVARLKSPYEMWRTDRNFVKRVIMKAGILSCFNLREAIWAVGKEASQFKVTAAYAVYKYFNPTRTLDFCAGWGDRLIAALACSVDYTGYDPNHTLKRGHDQIIRTLPHTSPAEIHYRPFEDSDDLGTYDLIFTSPPFYNLETYLDCDRQSSRRYPDFVQWLVHFLFTVLDIAWSKLVYYGNMIIYIDNVDGNDIITPMTCFALTYLPGCTLKGVIQVEGSRKRRRSMYHFYKDPAAKPQRLMYALPEINQYWLALN